MRQRVYDALVCLAMAAMATALILFPRETTQAAKDGLTLCGNVIVPSLFPFFVLSTLVVETGVSRRFGRLLEPIMRPLFNVGGDCVTPMVLGFIGGYPVGAKTVISLYESGGCTKTEAERLLSFCNNSGPAFIFGVVGAGVFASGRIGLLLYLAHCAASICVGVLFRKWGSGAAPSKAKRAVRPKPKPFAAAFTESVRSSFQSTVNICGFVIFFTVFIKMLFLTGALPALARGIGALLSPLGMDAEWAERLLTGVIEISSGVWTLSGARELTASVAMAAFMLGWAGLSVHSQVLSFIGTSGLSVKTYILGKLLQGLLSAGLVFALSRVLLPSAPASYLAEQVGVFTRVGFVRAGAISCVAALIMFGIFAAASRGHAKTRD